MSCENKIAVKNNISFYRKYRKKFSDVYKNSKYTYMYFLQWLFQVNVPGNIPQVLSITFLVENMHV